MRDIKQIPTPLFYPGDFPLRYDADEWSVKIKSDLAGAVKHYFNYFIDEEPVCTRKEQDLIIEFLIYFINAPIWCQGPSGDEYIKPLMNKANRMKTLEDVHEFIEDCIIEGMDPF